MAGRFGHVGWRQARSIEVVAPPQPEVQRQATVEVEQEQSLVSRLVLGLVLLYAFVFAALSVQQHLSYQTNAFDLGNMDQAVWNTAEGRPFEFSNWEGGTSRLAAHVEPILLLVAQVYRLHPDATTLLVLQSVVISLGALPAFWLARRVLHSDFAAAVFAGSYLLSPALEIANLADFHAVAFSSALLLFAFYFMYRRRYLWFALFAVLAMATKEHVPFSVFLMGLYIAVIQRQRWVGGVTCAVAAVWAAVAFGVVIPHFNPQGASPYLSRYDQLGKSPSQMVWTLVSDPGTAAGILSQPAKVNYVLNVLSPTLFLSVLSPFTLVMTGPDFGINLLSNFSESFAGHAHYGAVIVPFVTASAVLGAGLVRRLLLLVHPVAAQVGVAAVSVAVLLSSVVSFQQQVLLPLSDHLPAITDHDAAADEVLRLIPSDAAVSASSTLNPHVSQRRQLSLFPDFDKADYVVVDVTASPYPIDAASQWYKLQQMLQGGEWGVAGGKDGVLLLRRQPLQALPARSEPGLDTTDARDAGATVPAATLPEEFYSFMEGDNCKGGKDAGVSFGPNLRLARYRVEPAGAVHGNDPFARLALCWETTGKIEDDVVASVAVVDEQGATVFIDRFQPAFLWRPASQWQQGQRVQATVPWLPLGTAERVELRVSIRQRAAPFPLAEGMEPGDVGRNTLGLRGDGSLALAVVEHER